MKRGKSMLIIIYTLIKNSILAFIEFFTYSIEGFNPIFIIIYLLLNIFLIASIINKQNKKRKIKFLNYYFYLVICFAIETFFFIYMIYSYNKFVNEPSKWLDFRGLKALFYIILFTIVNLINFIILLKVIVKNFNYISNFSKTQTHNLTTNKFVFLVMPIILFISLFTSLFYSNIYLYKKNFNSFLEYKQYNIDIVNLNEIASEINEIRTTDTGKYYYERKNKEYITKSDYNKLIKGYFTAVKTINNKYNTGLYIKNNPNISIIEFNMQHKSILFNLKWDAPYYSSLFRSYYNSYSLIKKLNIIQFVSIIICAFYFVLYSTFIRKKIKL